MKYADTLQHFLFENNNIRGTFIHLQTSYQAARDHYQYPEIVAQQLG